MVMVEHHGVRAKQDTVSDGRFSKNGYAGSAIHEQTVPDAKGTTLNNAYVCTGLNDNIVTNLHMAAFPQSKAPEKPRGWTPAEFEPLPVPEQKNPPDNRAGDAFYPQRNSPRSKSIE